MRKAGLIFGLVIAFGCVPEGKIYDPEAAASPSKDKRQPPAKPQRPAGTAHPGDVYDAVVFIRRNAERHRHAVDVCGVAMNCTDFQPFSRDGEERLNLPKYAKVCLEDSIPRCEEALDQLEMHPPPSTIPQSVRANYMKWVHEAPSIQLRIQKLELQMLEDYGKPIKMKKEGEGYQGFWSYWVPKHSPSNKGAYMRIWEERTDVHTEGFQGLKDWLTPNGACIEGANCYPNKVESGGSQLNARFRGAL